MRWEKITLRQFQYIERINADPQYDDMDRTMHTACVLFGYTETTFGKAGLKKAQRLIKKTNQCFAKPFPERSYNRVGRYFVNYDLDRLRFGQYVELTHFLQGNLIENAAMILASVAHLPLLKNKSEHHQSVSEYFLGQPITKVVGSVKYVIEMFGRLNKEYSGLFDLDDTEQEPEEIEQDFGGNDFNKLYGWVYSATAVAEHERITLEQAFDIPVRQALNDLSYLKAKRQYDEQQLKKHGKINQ